MRHDDHSVTDTPVRLNVSLPQRAERDPNRYAKDFMPSVTMPCFSSIMRRVTTLDHRIEIKSDPGFWIRSPDLVRKPMRLACIHSTSPLALINLRLVG